ncbi:hypothetical protein ACMDCR_27020 [Labrys okinawensis]
MSVSIGSLLFDAQGKPSRPINETADSQAYARPSIRAQARK